MAMRAGDFVCDYAPTGTAKCKHCKKNISQNSIRMGRMAQSPFFDGLAPLWYHKRCFFQHPFAGTIRHALEIRDPTQLRWEDQERVHLWVGDWPLGAPDAPPDRDVVFPAEAVVDGEEHSDLVARAKRELQAENEKIWQLIPRLCASRHLKRILVANGYAEAMLKGGTSRMARRCAEGMLYGAAPLCPACGSGSLRLLYGCMYYCTGGSASKWSRCTFSTPVTDPRVRDLPRAAWVMPPADPSADAAAAEEEANGEGGEQAEEADAEADVDTEESPEMEVEEESTTATTTTTTTTATTPDATATATADTLATPADTAAETPADPLANTTAADTTSSPTGDTEMTTAETIDTMTPESPPQKPAKRRGGRVVPPLEAWLQKWRFVRHVPSALGQALLLHRFNIAHPPAKDGEDPTEGNRPNIRCMATVTLPAVGPLRALVGLPATAPPGKPFEGMLITFASPPKTRTQKEASEYVRAHGGTVVMSDYAYTHAAVVGDRKAKGVKVDRARSIGTRIVLETYLDACARADARLPMDEYCVALPKGAEAEAPAIAMTRTGSRLRPGAKRAREKPVGEGKAPVRRRRKSPEENLQTVFVKGRAAIDPPCPLANRGHILQEDAAEPGAPKEIYAASLSLADLEVGSNSYYILQLIETDPSAKSERPTTTRRTTRTSQAAAAGAAEEPPTWCVWRRWGRIGTRIGGSNLIEYFDKDGAKEAFCEYYLSKTGTHWAERRTASKVAGKYCPVDVDYSGGTEEEEEEGDLLTLTEECTLHPLLRRLIEMLFNRQAMAQALIELKLDISKMPLGKLTPARIHEGADVLHAIQAALEAEGVVATVSTSTTTTTTTTRAPLTLRERLMELSSRFYTVIPHSFGMMIPPVIETAALLQEKAELLDTLLDMETALSLITAERRRRLRAEGKQPHPLDTHYAQLRCAIEPIGRDAPDYALVERYLTETHGPTHSKHWRLEIDTLFRMDREGEAERFRTDIPNHMLLWHGSRTTNYASILSQGLRIAPENAPVTGYMFGKGVYFADCATKSAQYCHASRAQPTGLLILAEVALGEPHRLTQGCPLAHPPEGCDSVMGLGALGPDPATHTVHEGAVVPIGAVTKQGGGAQGAKTDLIYNEFIVYDVVQIRLRYLVLVRFLGL